MQGNTNLLSKHRECVKKPKKTLLVILAILLMTSIQSIASVSLSQGGKITIKEKNIDLDDLIWQLEKQTGYDFIFNSELLGKHQNLKVDVEGNIDEVLNTILKDKALTYEVENGIYIIRKKVKQPVVKKAIKQQSVEVKGQVTDAEGLPLPGVSVVVKGTSVGVATNIDGVYSIEVDNENTVLVFSFVGMLPQEIKVGKSTSIDITLSEDEAKLGEVVVTGYTQVKKETYTGASVTLRPEVLKKANVETSFLKTLQGQAPGLLVTDNVGSPDEGPSVTIRGTGSISASSSPLIIVDGAVIASLSMINAADVESVTIQKDATATAIYGSRGSNGVIIITTKKGMPGKPSVNYDFRQGFGFVEKSDVELMSASQKLGYEVDLGLRTQDEADELLATGINTDWRDEMYKTSKIQTHNLSISGGTAAARYSFSFGYHDEETSYDSGFEKYNARLNMDSKITNKLSVGVNLMFSRTDFDDNRQADFDLFANTYLPYENGRDEDGEYTRYISGEDNLMYLKDKRSDSRQSNAINAIGFANYKILPDLVFRSQLAVSYSSADGKSFIDPSLAESWIAKEDRGQLTKRFSKGQTITGTHTLNYSKAIESTHYIKALVGMETIESKWGDFYGTGNGFINGLVQTLDAAAQAKELAGGDYHKGMLSYFSQLSYSYKEKLFTDVSFRRDGSSYFGENKRYANFWSVGGGWNIHKEDFMQSLPLDLLKLKGSIGTSGNSNIGGYQAKMLFAYNAQYAGTPGVYPDRMENKDLGWEKNLNFGIGIDYALFNSRLRGTVDYYQRKTDDLLLGVNPLGTSGFAVAMGNTSYTTNIGEMVNKGLDISLSGDVIRTEDLKWSLTLNLSYNENEIKKLVDDNDLHYTHYTNSVGEAYKSLYLAKWKGVDPETGQNQYLDEAGELTFDPSYKQVVGKSQAPYYGGFISDIRYKNFELHMLFSFAQGKYSLNQGLYDLYNTPTMNQSVDVLNAWKEEGDEATIAKRGSSWRDVDAQYTTQYMENSSYIRLKSVNLAYNLPESWLRKVKLSKAKIYVQGQNLLTWTDYSVGNPEFAGLLASYPPNVRKVLFGLNVSF